MTKIREMQKKVDGGWGERGGEKRGERGWLWGRSDGERRRGLASCEARTCLATLFSVPAPLSDSTARRLVASTACHRLPATPHSSHRLLFFPPNASLAPQLAMSAAATSDGLNDVYETLERYNWDDDVEFQSGLSAILGSNASPEQASELALRARCFYYARWVASA